MLEAACSNSKTKEKTLDVVELSSVEFTNYWDRIIYISGVSALIKLLHAGDLNDFFWY